MTVPVVKQKKPLREIRIQNGTHIKNIDWNDYHRTFIDSLYHAAPEYRRHQEFLDHLYTREWTYLVDLNLTIIEYLLGVFQIPTPVVKSSALLCEQEGSVPMAAGRSDPTLPGHTEIQGMKQRATQRIVAICQEVGADTYLSGACGREYMDISLFENAGITVETQEFHHPVYPQTFIPFISNLAALDYILNVDITDPGKRDLITISANNSPVIKRGG